MEQVLQLLTAHGDLVVYTAIFASVTLVTLAIANISATWADVRRRAVAGANPAVNDDAESVLYGGSQLEFLKGLMPADESKKTELMRFLNSAGYYGTGALIRFQALRIASAIAVGGLSAISFSRMYPDKPFAMVTAISVALTFAGYMLPRSIVSMRRDKLFEEHRQGFPDLLDLLVICVEAGIGIETAVERVGRDLSRDYPSLGRNLGFMSLELRAGKSTREALDNLSVRLGIPEARSFATLIQQSEELGTSLVTSLRVYSNEMRAKRLSRAEEKAHALPVKLVLPLALFIFPVILGVTLMPVAMKLYKALGI